MRQLRIVVAALAVAFLTAACGDSDDEATADGATATEIREADATTEAPTAETTTESDAAATTSDPGTSTTRDSATEQFSGADSDEFCGLAESLDIEGAISGVESGAELEAAFDEVLGMLQRLDDAAPAEIDDDVALVTEAWAGLREPLAAADWNLLRVDPATLSGPDQAAQDAASDRLDAYISEVCGIEPSTAAGAEQGATG